MKTYDHMAFTLSMFCVYVKLPKTDISNTLQLICLKYKNNICLWTKHNRVYSSDHNNRFLFIINFLYSHLTEASVTDESPAGG